MAFVRSTAPPLITRNIVMLLSKIAAATLFLSAAVARYCKNTKPTKDWELYVYPNIDCDKGNDILAIDSFRGNFPTSPGVHKSGCLNLKNVDVKDGAKSIIFNARSNYSLYLHRESGCKGGAVVIHGPYYGTPDGAAETVLFPRNPPKSFDITRYH
ncbi:hypothetical protein BV22DRAFT_1124759 [Leucogyrophana mollusca]|uniref:Uncharacterized protein n=1 Tax=Leucogyrophana mollusca TaxID=85980 RepID=A0ACB8BZU1_9AGAM|nr:hypothetical protein BV22DRAFT_1124759 [Leucogyrophana mollusca]